MTTVIVFIIVLILAGIVFFFHHQNKLKLRARLMREAVRNHEFTFHLPVTADAGDHTTFILSFCY